MNTWMTVLCAAALLCVPLGGEIHEWTNTRGQTIQAEFISATEKTVIISMKGKTYVVKLADLTPPSRALAAKLRVQKSTAQKPVTKVVVEAPKVVVDVDQLGERDGLIYIEGKPFTGVAVQKHDNGQKFETTYKDGKKDGLYTRWYENGQKWQEVTYKDGKLNGLGTKWYENGQKEAEATFKDGEKISEKNWDRDGKPLGQDQEGGAPNLDGEQVRDSSLTEGGQVLVAEPSDEEKYYELTVVANLGGPGKTRFIKIGLQLVGLAGDFEKLIKENEHSIRDKALTIMGQYTLEDTKLNGIQERVRVNLKKGFSVVLKKYRNGESDLIRNIYFTQFVIQ